MASDAQTRANQANATHSTGPRTPEGKAVSRFNALTHGITAEHVVLPDEDPNEFAALKEDLYAELQPAGELEAMQADLFAAYAWRLRRAMRVEKGIFTREVYNQIAKNASDTAHRLISYPDDHSAGRLLDILDAPDRGEPVINDRGAYDAAVKRRRDAAVVLASGDVALGDAFIRDVQSADAFSKLSRYEKHIQQSMFRALHELRRMQAARNGSGTRPVTPATPRLAIGAEQS
jgi:hypothetical protein